MIAKVDLSFKFIGGSSLGGPIKQLQNAVTFNFFANTGVYNPARVAESLLEDRRRFVYGAFKTPWEADDVYENLNTIPVDSTKKEVPVNNNDTSGAGMNTEEKAAIEAVQNGTQAASTSGQPPTPPVNEDEDIMDVIGTPLDLTGSFLSKITFSVKEDKKDKWDIFALDYNYKDPCGSGTAQRGSVSSDNKSAVYNLESDLIECNEFGDYSYQFTIWFQATEKTPDPKTGTPYYKQIVKSHKITNTAKK